MCLSVLEMNCLHLILRGGSFLGVRSSQLAQTVTWGLLACGVSTPVPGVEVLEAGKCEVLALRRTPLPMCL